MSGSEDENPRRTRHATDGKTVAAAGDAGAPRRRRGRRAPINFEREMRTMAASENTGLEIGLKSAAREGSHQKVLLEIGGKGEQERQKPEENLTTGHTAPSRSYQQPHRYEDDQQAQRPFPPVITESPKQTRSFEVDDDDKNLPFSAGIRNASIPHEFCVPKITPYTGKGDPLDHVNTYKMEMSLRGATLLLKYRAFHLTLSGEAKRWYNKLVAGSISSWSELKKTFINYFSSGRPASAPVQRLHDIRQAESERLQSYLSRFNEEILFCERISDAEALSTLKGGLDMNLSFWRDVRNKNPTTFDQLVEMIIEEITNENMILHRNRGGVAPNQMPRVSYGRNQGRQLPPSPPRRRDYPADPNSGISYVTSTQEGLHPPYPVQMAPGPSIEAYNYGMAVPTYYEAGTSALPILPPCQEMPNKYCLVHQSHWHSTEECHEVENLASKR
ncbi:Uncharacterized protein Adt_23547 [Abeliophyllum distichum]|uniref:Retrotransposon gag domain-containing protein n=1 Tax=Abeliophyllum distichum TaxID=126358 RepID=A0ABD1SB70_9LAMI